MAPKLEHQPTLERVETPPLADVISRLRERPTVMTNLAGYVVTYSNAYRTNKANGYTAVLELTDESISG
jgi:hypothetical protein